MVKRSLTTAPLVGIIIGSYKVVPVDRKNPREDLEVVYDLGKKMLDEGRSLVLFPEATRRDAYDVKNFNSMGVKLALKAGKPVVPVALKTDFWGPGRLIKEAGAIFPDKPIRFRIGRPIMPEGRGKAQHREAANWIRDSLIEWGCPVAGDPA